VVAGASTSAETSTFRTGSNPAILFYFGDRLRPVTREDISSIQALHADRGRILVLRDTTPLQRPRRVNAVVRPVTETGEQRMNGTKAPWFLSAICLLASCQFAAAIVIRPDRPDSRYLEFGKKFPAVCKVKWRKAQEMVRGKERRTRELYGSGILVTPTWVLTVGHVVEGASNSPQSIVAIFDDQEYEVRRVVVHPDYPTDPEQLAVGGDIALLELSKPVIGIRPVPLFVTEVVKGQAGILVGFGVRGTFATGALRDSWDVANCKPERRAGTNLVAGFPSTDPDCFETRIRPVDSATDLEAFGTTGDSGGPFLVEVSQGFAVAGLIRDHYGADDDDVVGNVGDRNGIVRIATYGAWIEDVTGADFGVSRPCRKWLLAIPLVAVLIFAFVRRRWWTRILTDADSPRTSAQ